ncbi:MAG: efflux RND transporter periplasmic adaptor subunit [Sporocytophaga sp.]|uniref:efflux RND transporter periplasmic adaptor subunit n=1 Tax=Sporocytophaga sp. TaxID=2231183 RepID=UPI001B0BBB8C|nr:efflux RND transporter periplasmic adaptor subunit [Sporocytophaga sp.]MBO9700420.1 efflux RND transporter periplasmic adaptor subunit [Sporocytophaga sp.]
MTKKRSYILIIVLAIIFVLVVLRLCSNKKEIDKSKETSTTSPKVSVNVYKVIRQNISDELQLLGTIIPNKTAVVISEIQGKLINLPIEKGDVKDKGDLLAQIESKEQTAAVRKSELALEKARKDVERYTKLFKGNAVTKQQLEEAKIALKTADFNLQQDKKKLSNANIRAPFKGMITERFVEPGATVMAGNQIARIVDVSSLKIDLSVAEKDAYKLKLNDKVKITTNIYPDTVFEGIITFISPTGDDAHNYNVEIRFHNPKENSLKAGTFVNVGFGILTQGNPLVIPRESLVGSVDDPQVYIIEKDTARLRSIQIGQSFPEKVEVTKGLKDGDQIVKTGLINLKDKTPVQIIGQ